MEKPVAKVKRIKFYLKTHSLKVIMDTDDDGRKSIKVWGNAMRAYYYESRDQNYYND